LPATDQCSGARPLSPSPVEARLSTQPFALRQRRQILRSVPAAGSTPLASRLRCDSSVSAQPVRLHAPARGRLFVASRGTFNACCPLPGPILKFPVCCRASAPLQDLSILRDQSAQPDFKRGSLPLRVARSSFAPRNARNNFLSTLRHGSSFWIRYFPPGSQSNQLSHLRCLPAI